MKSIWVNYDISQAPLSIHPALAKGTDKEYIKVINKKLSGASNSISEEELKEIVCKNKTTYWWKDYYECATSISSKKYKWFFTSFFDYKNTHYKIFSKFIFKGLTTEINGFCYDWEGQKKYEFYRARYFNNHFFTYLNCLVEDIKLQNIISYIWFWYWMHKEKIFFKYNYEITLLILIMMLDKLKKLSLLPIIAKNLVSLKKDIKNPIKLLYLLIK